MVSSSGSPRSRTSSAASRRRGGTRTSAYFLHFASSWRTRTATRTRPDHCVTAARRTRRGAILLSWTSEARAAYAERGWQRLRRLRRRRVRGARRRGLRPVPSPPICWPGCPTTSRSGSVPTGTCWTLATALRRLRPRSGSASRSSSWVTWPKGWLACQGRPDRHGGRHRLGPGGVPPVAGAFVPPVAVTSRGRPGSRRGCRGRPAHGSSRTALALHQQGQLLLAAGAPTRAWRSWTRRCSRWPRGRFADGDGDRLLRRDRWLLDGLRAAPGARVDGGDVAVVRLPAGVAASSPASAGYDGPSSSAARSWTDAIAELGAARLAESGDYWAGAGGLRAGKPRPAPGSVRLGRGCFAEAARLGVDPQPVSRCCAWPVGACRRPPRWSVVPGRDARTTQAGRGPRRGHRDPAGRG